MNYTSTAHAWLSFPPGYESSPPSLLPADFTQQDLLFTLFELLIHWMAYFIACASVTVSLMVCMAIILFSCVCVLEMVIQFTSDVLCFVKGQ